MKYRKVDPRIWNDSKFRKLNDAGKLAFFFLLTHPHMTAIGAMRASIAGLAAELGWSSDAMRDAISDAIRYGMVVVNPDASFVGLPNFIKYNKPEGPNSVIKAWPAAIEMLPECPEKRDLAIRCKRFLDELGPNFFAKSDTSELLEAIEHAIRYAIPDAIADAIPDAIPDAMREPSPIQEQEQEQEQKGMSSSRGVQGGADGASPSAPPAPAPGVASGEKTIGPRSAGSQARRSGQPSTEVKGQGELEGFDIFQGPEVHDDLREAIRESQTKIARRLPVDFVVPSAWVTYALKSRPDLTENEIRAIGETFCNHWIAKPGKDGTKLNWVSTWLNWVKREKSMASSGGNGNGVRQSRLLKPKDDYNNDKEIEEAEMIARRYGARITNMPKKKNQS